MNDDLVHESLSGILARHVAGASFEGLSPGAVRGAKHSLLDAIGVSLAASTLGEGCDAFADLARAGGEGPCAVLGYGLRANLLPATLANGALAHALDYEDALDGAPIHPNAPTIAAALSVAQHLGGVSGERLITAVAVGCDIVCRLGMALTANPDDYGWYPPPILGAQGAVAASAVLMGLNEGQVLDAFGLALGPSGQSAQFKKTPASALRAVRDGFSAHAGVLAVLLAQRGVRAFDQPIEGKAGFFALYARGAYDPAVLTDGLGQHWWGEDIAYKPWPSCRGTHAAVEAALALRDESGQGARVVRAQVIGSPIQKMLAEPPAQKQAPETAIDAKFSLPFTVASALIHGRITLDSFSAEALREPSVRDLAAKVDFAVDPAFGMADATRGTLELTLEDGRRLRHEVVHPRGHPTNPMSPEAMLAKFRDCAKRALKPPRSADLLAQVVLNLQEVDDLDPGLFKQL